MKPAAWSITMGNYINSNVAFRRTVTVQNTLKRIVCNLSFMLLFVYIALKMLKHAKRTNLHYKFFQSSLVD